MSLDKNNPAAASDDQTRGQTESLESAEMDDIDLETVSGGMTLHPAAGTGNCGTATA